MYTAQGSVGGLFQFGLGFFGRLLKVTFGILDSIGGEIRRRGHDMVTIEERYLLKVPLEYTIRVPELNQ